MESDVGTGATPEQDTDVGAAGRRSFLSKLGAAASVAALGVLGCSPDEPGVAGPGRLRPNASIMLPPKPTSLTREFRDQVVDLPEFSPSYLPPEYRLWGSYLHRPDGFGGGDQEVSYWYRSTLAENAGRNALAIYATRWPTKPFGGTHEREGTPIEVTFVTGGSATATYFDGAWRLDDRGTMPSRWPFPLRWDSGNTHSLTLEWQGIHIGVRGRRKAGISMQDLVQVASGLRFT
jgi:hypothetical protein